MDYKEAVQFHEETKAYGSILGLDSIRALMHELGDVWEQLKIVHIAGTNGKGSVCCFLASVLKEAGYQVAQYNSPAVFHLREVYQINGQWISEEEYAAAMTEVAAACERMTGKGHTHPTVFEVETALAFFWFYQKKCDIVLLETGMGGSTDATNLITKPLCSVFVSISMDHMDFLGDSLTKIAEIKSGIIKSECPVITTQQPVDVETVLQCKAKECHAPYYLAAQIRESHMDQGKLCYEHPLLGEVHLSMTGAYQVQNSALAIEVLQVLRQGQMGYPVTDEQIRTGLASAQVSGRFECISSAPRFYIDGAHNVDAANKLKQSLIANFPNTKRIGIMGVMADKSYCKMLDLLLPLFERVYTVKPDNPRALSAEALAQEISKRGKEALAEPDVSTAVGDAWQLAEEEKDTMIVAFGSLYYLKEVKSAVNEITAYGITKSKGL